LDRPLPSEWRPQHSDDDTNLEAQARRENTTCSRGSLRQSQERNALTILAEFKS
jgi:hypothetical protein